MDLKLSDDQLRALVTEALFQKLDPEIVKKMVTDALGILMVPQQDQYGGRRSNGRLQMAVEDALLRVAKDVCTEELAKGDVREQIASLVREALAKVMEKDRAATVDMMAGQLSKALCQGS